MHLHPLTHADDPEWLALRTALWPECPRDEHLQEMALFAQQPARYAQFILTADDGRGLGLAEAAIRTDYVNGTETSPVAYLEGLYVRPDVRGRGVARRLVAAVEAWARGQGCAELASDTQPENTVSQAVHARLGFVETDRAVFFSKRLAPAPAPGPAFELQPLGPSHFDRLHDLFDAVCRERRFLAFTQAGPREQTAAYYRGIVARGETHFVAVDAGRVVGWCDVLQQFADVRRHVGTLGMAVAASHRGQGVGRALITRAIEHASARGLTRIELTVHVENHAAQALYRSVGFEHEGTQRRAWRIDGRHFDVHAMARLAAVGPSEG